MPACLRTSTRLTASECYALIMGTAASADLAPCRERCAAGRALMDSVSPRRPQKLTRPSPMREADAPHSTPALSPRAVDPASGAQTSTEPPKSRPPAWLSDTLAHLIKRYPVADLQGLKFFRLVAQSFGFAGSVDQCRAACEAAGLTVSGKARPYVEIKIKARKIAKLSEAR